MACKQIFKCTVLTSENLHSRTSQDLGFLVLSVLFLLHFISDVPVRSCSDTSPGFRSGKPSSFRRQCCIVFFIWNTILKFTDGLIAIPPQKVLWIKTISDSAWLWPCCFGRALQTTNSEDIVAVTYWYHCANQSPIGRWNRAFFCSSGLHIWITKSNVCQ